MFRFVRDVITKFPFYNFFINHVDASCSFRDIARFVRTVVRMLLYGSRLHGLCMEQGIFWHGRENSYHPQGYGILSGQDSHDSIAIWLKPRIAGRSSSFEVPMALAPSLAPGVLLISVLSIYGG